MTNFAKTALVTGAGRGLGAELAKVLARRGVAVVLCARTAAEVETVAEGIRREGGVAHALVADLADKAAIYPLAGAAAALVGPIELLVHNAASLGPVPLRLLLDTDCEDVERALAVNVVGAFRLSKALAGAMLVRGHGTIVAVSSDAAVDAYPRWGAYGLSKAALEHMVRTLAVELEGTGVRALTVDPGEMDTRMHAEAVPEADASALRSPRLVAEQIVHALALPGKLANGARYAVEVAS